MCENATGAPDRTGLRLQAALAEYGALRTETLQKFTHHLQLYTIAATALVALTGWALADGTYDALLLAPIVTAPFALRYLWEQRVIDTIGEYLSMMEEQVFPALLNTPGEADRRWIGWQHYFEEDDCAKKPDHKVACAILLVGVPVAEAVLYSAVSLWSRTEGFPWAWSSELPRSVYVAAIGVYTALGVALALALWGWDPSSKDVDPDASEAK